MASETANGPIEPQTITTPGYLPDPGANIAPEVDTWKEALAVVTPPKDAEPAVEPKTETTPVAEAEIPGDDKTVEKPDSKPAESAATFDDTLLAHAAEHGFSAEEAKAYANPDILRRILANADKAMVKYATQKTPTAAEPAKPVEQPAPQQPVTADATLPDLDPETVDPDVAKWASTMKQQMAADRQTIQQLQQQLQQFMPVAQQYHAQQQEQTWAKVDAAFAALGADDVLGASPTRKLAPNSELRKARERVIEVANGIEMALRGQGREIEVGELIRRAYYAEYGDKLKTIAKAEVQKEVEKDAEEADVLPTRRVTKARETSKSNLEKVQDVLAKYGRA